MPIHVHTHDTAGTGVATYLARARRRGRRGRGDRLDERSHGSAGHGRRGWFVSRWSFGHGRAINDIAPLIDYWESTRVSYAAFESGQKSGSAEVYAHEVPGGQYTNMLFQATQNGLAEQWPAVKRMRRPTIY